MKKDIPKVTVQSLNALLDAEFKRWEHIRDHGCADPFWEDGCNMNLVRNHIIYAYRQLAELMDGIQISLFQPAAFKPEDYGLRPIPPEYPIDWMCPTGDYPDRLDKRKGEYRECGEK